MSFSEHLESIANGVNEHIPEILFGISLTAGVGSAIYGIAVTPKAVDEIMQYVIENVPEEKRRGLRVSELHRLIPFKTKVKLCWKLYLPFIIGELVCIGTGIAGEIKHGKKEMAYAALASCLETRLKDITESTKEVVGDKKYDEIEASAAQKAIDRSVKQREETDDQVLYLNKKTEGFPLIDDITGRKMIVDRDDLDKCQAYLNRLLWSKPENEVELNCFYRFFNAPTSSIGDDLVWDSEDGDIDFLSDMRAGWDDGIPTGVLHLKKGLCVKSGHKKIRFY